MADYDHHRHVAERLWEHHVASNGDLVDGLSAGYLDSYSTSPGIEAEHGRDIDKIVQTLRHLPDFWQYLRRLAAAPDHRIGALDVGAGEAAKSVGIQRALQRELRHGSGLGEVVLWTSEPDETQRERSDRWVNALPYTVEDLVAHVRAGTVKIEPTPAYLTCLHVAYYLEQRDGTIPVLADLVELVHQDGLLIFVVEGPGQLQEMKQHMRATRGLGEPASAAMILRTLDQAGIPHASPPIVIPNRSWRVDKGRPPGEMFRDDFLFLLEGNWGNNRPVGWDDCVAAGQWVQDNAIPDGNGGWCLDGGDDLIVAGRRLANHPADLAVLNAMGRTSAETTQAPR